MIDWNRVRDLHDEIGADAFEEVLSLFCEEVQDGLEKLQSAEDPTAQAAAFHFLKGAALNLGITDMARHCAEGEARNAGGIMDDAALTSVLASFPQHMVELQQTWQNRVQST